MDVIVEPRDGPELDRLITALLNATGVVHHLFEVADDRPDTDGLESVGRVAERLRPVLSLVAEQHPDEDLAVATQVLAKMALLAAGEARPPN